MRVRAIVMDLHSCGRPRDHCRREGLRRHEEIDVLSGVRKRRGPRSPKRRGLREAGRQAAIAGNRAVHQSQVGVGGGAVAEVARAGGGLRRWQER
eukprot:5896243-Lingulodinium_polyedra.AAC.1